MGFSHSESPCPLGSRNPLETLDFLWNTLTSLLEESVFIVDVNGRVHYTNPEGSHILSGLSGRIPEDSPENIDPTPRIAPGLEFVRTAIAQSRVVKSSHYVDAHRVLCTVIPLGDLYPAATAALVLCRSVRADETVSIEQLDRDAGSRGLGALSALTRRELTVLAMIGAGLGTHLIAESLKRSPRTIEGHVASILRKLRVTRRIELVPIALNAGLKWSAIATTA